MIALSLVNCDYLKYSRLETVTVYIKLHPFSTHLYIYIYIIHFTNISSDWTELNHQGTELNRPSARAQLRCQAATSWSCTEALCHPEMALGPCTCT